MTRVDDLSREPSRLMLDGRCKIERERESRVPPRVSSDEARERESANTHARKRVIRTHKSQCASMRITQSHRRLDVHSRFHVASHTTTKKRTLPPPRSSDVPLHPCSFFFFLKLPRRIAKVTHGVIIIRIFTWHSVGIIRNVGLIDCIHDSRGLRYDRTRRRWTVTDPAFVVIKRHAGSNTGIPERHCRSSHRVP